MNYRSLYVSFLKPHLRLRRPLRIVFDASNGTVGPILEELFRSARGTFRVLNGVMDGSFPAHGPNPLARGSARDLRDAVRRDHADVGVLFDADGDRALFMDERGDLIDPDAVLYLLARARRGPFLVDVRTGWLIRRHIPTARWRVVPVGHTNIKRAMRADRVSFAGERSGHYYFHPSPRLYMDSGILAAAEFLSLYSASSTPLSTLVAALPQFVRSGEINFRVRDRQRAMADVATAYRNRAETIAHIDGLSMECGAFWFNLRPSGTEPLLRLNAESISQDALVKELERIRAITRR